MAKIYDEIQKTIEKKLDKAVANYTLHKASIDNKISDMSPSHKVISLRELAKELGYIIAYADVLDYIKKVRRDRHGD